MPNTQPPRYPVTAESIELDLSETRIAFHEARRAAYRFHRNEYVKNKVISKIITVMFVVFAILLGLSINFHIAAYKDQINGNDKLITFRVNNVTFNYIDQYNTDINLHLTSKDIDQWFNATCSKVSICEFQQDTPSSIMGIIREANNAKDINGVKVRLWVVDGEIVLSDPTFISKANVNRFIGCSVPALILAIMITYLIFIDLELDRNSFNCKRLFLIILSVAMLFYTLGVIHTLVLGKYHRRP